MSDKVSIERERLVRLWGLVDMLEPDLNGTGFGDWLTAMAMVNAMCKKTMEDGGKGVKTLFPAPVVTATYSGTVCGMGGISPREERLAQNVTATQLNGTWFPDIQGQYVTKAELDACRESGRLTVLRMDTKLDSISDEVSALSDRMGMHCVGSCHIGPGMLAEAIDSKFEIHLRGHHDPHGLGAVDLHS